MSADRKGFSTNPTTLKATGKLGDRRFVRVKNVATGETAEVPHEDVNWLIVNLQLGLGIITTEEFYQ